MIDEQLGDRLAARSRRFNSAGDPARRRRRTSRPATTFPPASRSTNTSTWRISSSTRTSRASSTACSTRSRAKYAAANSSESASRHPDAVLPGSPCASENPFLPAKRHQGDRCGRWHRKRDGADPNVFGAAGEQVPGAFGLTDDAALTFASNPAPISSSPAIRSLRACISSRATVPMTSPGRRSP